MAASSSLRSCALQEIFPRTPTRTDAFSADCIGLSRSNPFRAAHPARLTASQPPFYAGVQIRLYKSTARQPIGLLNSMPRRFRAPGWYLCTPEGSWHIPGCRRRHAVVASCDHEEPMNIYERSE
ncbi:hypothetical protein HBI37_183110 [Parastagonospora nodorum]|nr:hypothetical protein HBI37_183110 [Parastagonospora nodorum]KAH6341969.1 hypothetical protein HBI36_184230 [Parastagonospora nodorum]